MAFDKILQLFLGKTLSKTKDRKKLREQNKNNYYKLTVGILRDRET